MKVKVKYCGGCNPQINRADVVMKALNLLKDEYAIEVVDSDATADICLLACGCDALCLDREEYMEGCCHFVLIGGCLVNYSRVQEDGLPSAIAMEVKRLA